MELFSVPCRSASITNLSLDRSGSPMVPAYETSVSPQATRTHVKAETSEDERKILLVPFMLLFALLSDDSEVCFPCVLPSLCHAAGVFCYLLRLFSTHSYLDLSSRGSRDG